MTTTTRWPLFLIRPIALLFALAGPSRISAQPANWETAAGGKMQFEAASVKVADKARFPNFHLDAANYVIPSGRISAVGSLWTFISFAYKLNASPEMMAQALRNAPTWVSTELFDIQAIAGRSVTKDQIRLMLQSLLKERFGLVLKFETRDASVLALIVDKPGKLGPRIRPHELGPPCPESRFPVASTNPNDIFPPDCETTPARPKQGRIEVASRNSSIDLLIGALQRFGGTGFAGEIDRIIVDRTGLEGRYDFTLEFAGRGPTPPPPGGGPVATVPIDTEAAPFMQAVKEQLGLRLIRTRAPIRVMTVEHVERLSPN